MSEHLSNSYNWLARAHTCDKTGPLAGVPYDGADPADADVYHSHGRDFNPAALPQAMSRNAPDSWKQLYFKRTRQMVDDYRPDLLYTDGGIPFEEYGSRSSPTCTTRAPRCTAAR